MLFPRFSLKLILILNVGFALIFLAAKFAIAGESWAIGVTMAIVAMFLLMGLFGTMFFAAYTFSFLSRKQRVPQAESPFATDRLPPQVIPPRHVDE